jgi:hypothetical protein
VVRYTVRLAAYDTGKQTIPAFEVSYKDGDKNVLQAKSSPLAIEIEPMKAAQAEDGQPRDIRDIKPMQEIPTPAWMYAAAGIVVLVVLALVALGMRALVRRMRYRKPVPTTPHGIALAALDQLVADNLPAQGQLKLHYDRLAEILRSYLAQRFGLPVLEHTTAEVVTMMRDRNFEETLRTEVRLVLDEADLVKFAKLQVPVEKAFVQVHVVRGVVERTIPAPPQEGDGKPSAERTQQPAEAAQAASVRKEG